MTMTPEAYTLHVTKFQWKDHPAPAYMMLNTQHVTHSLEKKDITQNCVLLRLTVKLRNLLITTAPTQGLRPPTFYTSYTLIPIWVIPSSFIFNHRLWVGIQVE